MVAILLPLPPEGLRLQTVLDFLRSLQSLTHNVPNPFPSGGKHTFGGRETLWVSKHITDYSHESQITAMLSQACDSITVGHLQAHLAHLNPLSLITLRGAPRGFREKHWFPGALDTREWQ